jgi:hypothetical protein
MRHPCRDLYALFHERYKANCRLPPEKLKFFERDAESFGFRSNQG